MDICTIIWMIITAIVAGLGLYMILDKPKLVTRQKSGWFIEHKLINQFEIREYPSSTSVDTDKILKTRDYYTVYGITIHNEKSGILGRTEAKIHRAYINWWNSGFQPITERYLLRLWEDHEQPEVFPLLPNDKTSIGQSKTIGDGGFFDIVIAYNQENESVYYRWQISSGAYDVIPAKRDEFTTPMPHYAIVEIQAHRKNKKIYLRVDEIRKNRLNIVILEKGEFPKEITT